MARRKYGYQPYDLRRNLREVARTEGFDVGEGPSLEDQVCDFIEEAPTLEQMTTHAFDTPTIGSVGSPPKYRKRSKGMGPGKDLETGTKY